MNKTCVVCGSDTPSDQLAGDVCFGCADKYDIYGVYFCCTDE